MATPFFRTTSVARLVLALACTASFATASQAALFGDDEARRAIIELRQRLDAMQQSNQRASEDTSQLRRSLLDLQAQIETLRQDQARLRGQNEQLLQQSSELQRKQKDIAQGVEERLKQFEPVTVTIDGQQFTADPAEKRDFDAALEVFRGGKFADANKSFSAFIRQYPRSGYLPSARFWLGNAQYAERDYKEAIANFKSLLTATPEHARAPEAALSIANCQIELKDTRSARKTLEDLIKAYPRSEAANAAKEQLSRLK